MRVLRVPTATSRMSRRRCSTPISSASSASMMEGVWTKVLEVAVPSWVVLASSSNSSQRTSRRKHPQRLKAPTPSEATVYRNGVTHVLDLFHGKVSVCRHANLLWLHVDDDE